MSKRTKIVATVGPSTSSEEVLKAMVKEGVNVFRVNFSHGIHQDHINAIKKIHLEFQLNQLILDPILIL